MSWRGFIILRPSERVGIIARREVWNCERHPAIQLKGTWVSELERYCCRFEVRKSNCFPIEFRYIYNTRRPSQPRLGSTFFSRNYESNASVGKISAFQLIATTRIKCKHSHVSFLIVSVSLLGIKPASSVFSMFRLSVDINFRIFPYLSIDRAWWRFIVLFDPWAQSVYCVCIRSFSCVSTRKRFVTEWETPRFWTCGVGNVRMLCGIN